MDAKYRYLIKNTGILTVSNFSSKLLTFFLLPLYTSVLSVSDYGSYDLVVTTLSVALPVLTVNIIAGVMRFCMDASYDKAEIFSVGLKYSCASCCIVGAVLLVVSIFHLVPILEGCALLVFLYYVVTVLQQFAQNFSKGLERITDLGVGGVLGTVLSLLLTIVFLLVLKWGIRGFYLAHIVSMAFKAAFLLIRTRFWKYMHVQKCNETERAMVCYSAPLVALQLGWWVNASFDKYMVSAMLGTAENGLLSVAYKLPAVIHTVYGVFSPAWEISAIKEHESENVVTFYSSVFVYLNAALCLSCSLMIMLVKPISKILYAKEFFAAWRYVPYLLVSSVITESAAFFGAILTAKKDTKSLALSTLIGAFVNIVMNFVLIRFFGTLGAVLATVFSGIAIFMYRKWHCRALLLRKSLLIAVSAWFILILQSADMIHTDLYVLQPVLFCVVVALFFKPVLYAIRKMGVMVLRRLV